MSYYEYLPGPRRTSDQRDIYIEKSLDQRRDRPTETSPTAPCQPPRTIVVARSVESRAVGSPKTTGKVMIPVRKGEALRSHEMIRKLIAIQYDSNDIEFARGHSSGWRGDVARRALRANSPYDSRCGG